MHLSLWCKRSSCTKGLLNNYCNKHNFRLFCTTNNNLVHKEESIQHIISNEVKRAVGKAFGEQYLHTDPLVFPAKTNHGDYQSNIAMPLSKQLKLPPKEIANKIVNCLSTNHILASADISGPGFVNLHISSDFIATRFLDKVTDTTSRIGISPSTRNSTVVVDFSSPNIAKEMHVGHLRSTIIGDCLSRVLEFLGHKVVRINHVGDWGTQFGMLIHFLKTQYPHLSAASPMTFPELSIADVVKCYKESKQLFDRDERFKELARLEVVKLQQGDPLNKQLWQWLCGLSRQEYDEIYSLLKIEGLVERGESFYNHMLRDVVNDLKAQRLAEESNGATVIFLQGYKTAENLPLPLIVQKADGGYLYATTDLAALKYRIEHDGAKRIVYVTDAGQAQHFQMVFDAARKAGILPKSVEVVHVPFGLVLGADGKKISSRKKADSVRLKDLLDEAVDLARAEFLTRDHLLSSSLSPSLAMSAEAREERQQEIERRARVMGIAAVKYADLSMNRESNYRFSIEKMLSLQGNTAPYMLYAFVRIRGILRKLSQSFVIDEANKTVSLRSTTKRQDSDDGESENITLEEVEEFQRKFRQTVAVEALIFSEPGEVQLVKHLLRSDEVLFDVADKLQPHKICEYLFDLSQKFNSFYEQCPVIHAPSPEVQTSRIALCLLTADVLKLYLRLLGIETLEEI